MVHEIQARSLDRRTSRRSPVAEKHVDMSSVRVHVLCVIASLVAAVVFTVTEHEDTMHHHSLWCWLEIAAQIVTVILGTCYFRMRASLMSNSSVVTPLLIMVVALSLLCEPLQRAFFDRGHAFEVLVMHVQCHLMLGLAVCGFRVLFQRLAMLLGVCQAVFCTTISQSSSLLPMLVIFTVVALAWLIASHWERVGRRVLAGEQRRLSRTWLVGLAVIPVLVFAAAGFESSAVTSALSGFMPSSGGIGQFDPFARGGINDGDALVAGTDNVKSFAALEDAPFVEDDKPSLYDVYQEAYGKPNPKRRTDRAIPLPADLMKHIHQRMAKSKQAGREFSTNRRTDIKDRSRIRDLKSNALFYVSGRTPLHLRSETYDIFDGVQWYPEEADFVPKLHMEQAGDRHWLRLPNPAIINDVCRGIVTHALISANLSGRLVPTPQQTLGVSVDEVDRSSIYFVQTNRVVGFNRETIPEMIPIRMNSACIDPARLAATDAVTLAPQLASPYGIRSRTQLRSIGSLPDHETIEQITRLANAWTKGIPRSWGQVRAVVDAVRNENELDRDWMPGEECPFPAHKFLTESKRGPEHLFATSTAIALRCLGYETRLVSGFYARPEKYDARKQHTPVHAADAHVWAEVYVGGHMWIPLEASPGYELRSPPPTLWDNLRQFGRDLIAELVSHARLIVLGLFVLSAVVLGPASTAGLRLHTCLEISSGRRSASPSPANNPTDFPPSCFCRTQSATRWDVETLDERLTLEHSFRSGSALGSDRLGSIFQQPTSAFRNDIDRTSGRTAQPEASS